jgi:hypothetical protein
VLFTSSILFVLSRPPSTTYRLQQQAAHGTSHPTLRALDIDIQKCSGVSRRPGGGVIVSAVSNTRCVEV